VVDLAGAEGMLIKQVLKAYPGECPHEGPRQLNGMRLNETNFFGTRFTEYCFPTRSRLSFNDCCLDPRPADVQGVNVDLPQVIDNLAPL
jgi:hypothetical protein